MSRSWNAQELQAASAAMKAAGFMGYEEFCKELEKQSAPADGFEADYQAEQKNIQEYENAKAAGDESGMEAARAAHEELMEKIDAKGQI